MANPKIDNINTGYPAIDAMHSVAVDDSHGAIVEGDVNNLKSVEHQSCGVVACVTGEVEPWQIALVRANAEWVWHTHVAT